jgi:osmotically-inducible protein OsmY
LSFLDEALKLDPVIDSDDIVVELFNDDVVLNGTVPNQAQRAEATTAAQQVDGVTAVRNLLAIALPAVDYGDDAALARLVTQALAAGLAAPADVDVTASDGEIYLTGTVRPSAERTAAEACAASCAGVVSVTNEVVVLSD